MRKARSSSWARVWSQSRTVLEGKQLADLNGGHYVLAPLPLAQNLTGRQGQLDSILITTKPGADLATVRDCGHRRCERPGNRRGPESAGNSGRRRCQADELHGPDGRGGCFGGRRVPDLHHDDHGDQPAPAGHLDAARDRRPTRHNRSRHARGGGGSRTDRRSHRVGHRNTHGPHGDWPIASGSHPRARSSSRVLATRLRDTSRARGDGARQHGRVGDGCASGVQGFTDRGIGTGRGFCGGHRATMAADRQRGCRRRGVRGVDPDRPRSKRHLRFRRDVCSVLRPDRAWLRARRAHRQSHSRDGSNVRIGRGTRGGDDRACAAASVGHSDDRAHRSRHNRRDHRYERRHDPVGARHLLAGRGCRRVGERKSSRQISHRPSAAGSYRKGGRSAGRGPRRRGRIRVR